MTTCWTRITRPLLAVFALAALPTCARAQVLYAITHQGNQLITINPATGAGTLIGTTTSSMRAFGLGFRGTRLYTWDSNVFRIREIDPVTAAIVNTIDIGSNAMGEGDITFRSDGIGFLSPVAPSELVRFDITAPSSVIVGPLSVHIDGLVFNTAGVLYGLGESGQQLYTIDPASGFQTLVGNTGITGFTNMAGGDLAFDATGRLYAALSNVGSSPSFLYQLDPSTGVGTLIGNIGFNDITGLAFQPPVTPPPPPPLPPPPGPAGGGGEGSFPGCDGPSGSEGGFGFGGGRLGAGDARKEGRRAMPLLGGPFPDSAGGSRVFNMSHREEIQAATESTQPISPLWTVLALIAACGWGRNCKLGSAQK